MRRKRGRFTSTLLCETCKYARRVVAISGVVTHNVWRKLTNPDHEFRDVFSAKRASAPFVHDRNYLMRQMGHISTVNSCVIHGRGAKSEEDFTKHHQQLKSLQVTENFNHVTADFSTWFMDRMSCWVFSRLRIDFIS